MAQLLRNIVPFLWVITLLQLPSALLFPCNLLLSLNITPLLWIIQALPAGRSGTFVKLVGTDVIVIIVSFSLLFGNFLSSWSPLSPVQGRDERERVHCYAYKGKSELTAKGT